MYAFNHFFPILYTHKNLKTPLQILAEMWNLKKIGLTLAQLLSVLLASNSVPRTPPESSSYLPLTKKKLKIEL
jgi:hypothetical protein